MAVDVDIEAQIQFVTYIPTCLAGGVATIGDTCSIVQGVMGIRQKEAMVLDDGCKPRLRMKGHLDIEVVDILPAYPIQETHIIVSEGKELVKGVALTIIRIFVARSVVVA